MANSCSNPSLLFPTEKRRQAQRDDQDGTRLAFVGRGAAVERGSTSWLGTQVRVWRVPGACENDNGGFLPGIIRREQESMVHNPGRPAIAFSTDQRVLAFSDNYHITLWSGGVGQANSLRLSYPSPYHYWYWDHIFPFSTTGSMAFSSDGKMLAVGGHSRAGIWKMAR